MKKEKGVTSEISPAKKRTVRILLVMMTLVLLLGAVVTAASVGTNRTSSNESNSALAQVLNYDQAVSKVKQAQNAWYYFHVRVSAANSANGLIAIQLLFENMDSGIHELYMYDHYEGYFYDMYIPMNTKDFGKLTGIRLFNENSSDFTVGTIDVMPVEPGVRIPCWRFGLSDGLKINQKSDKTVTTFTETNATRLAVKIKGADTNAGRFSSTDSKLELELSYRRDSDNKLSEMKFDVNKYVAVQQAKSNYKLFSTEGKEETFQIIVYDFSYIQWMTLDYSGSRPWQFDSLKYDIIEYTYKSGDDSVSLSGGYTARDYVMELNKQFLTRFCRVQNKDFLTYDPQQNISLNTDMERGHYYKLMLAFASLTRADKASYADVNEYADTINKVILKGSVTEIEYAEPNPDEETVHLVDFYLVTNSDEKYEDSILLRYYWNSSLSGLSMDETIEMKNYMKISGRQVMYSRNHEIKDMESIYRVAVSYAGDDLPGAEYVVVQIRDKVDGEKKTYWVDYEGSYFTEILAATPSVTMPDRGINYAEVSFKSVYDRNLAENDLSVSVTYKEYFTGETITETVSLESAGMTLLKKGETYDIRVPIGMYAKITIVEFENEKAFFPEDSEPESEIPNGDAKDTGDGTVTVVPQSSVTRYGTGQTGKATAVPIDSTLFDFPEDYKYPFDTPEILTEAFCDIVGIRIIRNFSSEVLDTYKRFENIRSNDKSIRFRVN